MERNWATIWAIRSENSRKCGLAAGDFEADDQPSPLKIKTEAKWTCSGKEVLHQGSAGCE